MLPALLAVIRSVPFSLRRAAPGRRPEPEGAVAIDKAPPERAAPGARTPAEHALGRRQVLGAFGRGATTGVLSAGAFERCIERERFRAERGARRFSLVVLRQSEDERTARPGRATLTEFAHQLCRRLRSTDLVGLVGVERIDLLLTDTEPKGAQVVIAWARQAELLLGLELEHSIYVYPSAAEPSRSTGPTGPLQAGRGAPGLREGQPAYRKAASARVSSSVPEVDCPVRDLLPPLVVSTALRSARRTVSPVDDYLVPAREMRMAVDGHVRAQP